MNKRLSILLISVCAAAICAMFFFSGCGKKDKGAGGNAAGMEMVKTAAVVEVYDTITLRLRIKNIEDGEVRWSSSDPLTADVKNGVVRGLKEGTAVITAAAKNVSTSCEVTVLPSAAVPQLVLSENEVYILKGESFHPLELAVYVKGKPSGVQAEYHIAGGDGGVFTAELNGSKLSLTAVKAGDGVLTVWTEADGFCLAEEITVHVTEKAPVFDVKSEGISYADGTYLMDMCLSRDMEKIYPDESDLEADVYVNDKKVKNAAVSYKSSDSGTVKCENGKITAVSAGNAVITGSYAGYSFTVSVHVKRPVVMFENKVQIETARPGRTIDLSGVINGKTESLKVDGREILDRPLSGGKIRLKNLPALATELGEDRDIVIVTDKEIYKGKADLFSLVITDAADLELMRSVSEDANPIEKLSDGYFVQGDDIDFKGGDYKGLASYKAGAWTTVFNGVYDGRGHSISNFTIRASDGGNNNCGMFPKTSVNAVIKNLVLVNAVVPGCGGLISTEFSGTVENVAVYGSLKNGAVWAPASLVASKVHAEARIRNALAVASEAVTPDLYGGIIAGWDASNTNLTGCVGINLDGKNEIHALGVANLKIGETPDTDRDGVKTLNNLAAYRAWKAGADYDKSADWAYENGYAAKLNEKAGKNLL